MQGFLTPFVVLYGIAAAAVCGLVHYGLLPLNADIQILLAIAGLGGLLVAFIALQFESHRKWLHKGFLRERATEIIVPPAPFAPIIRLLHAQVHDLPAAQAFTNGISQRLYRRWVSIAYGWAASLLVVGIGLTLWRLYLARMAAAQADDSIGSLIALLQKNMATTALGFALALVGLVAARLLARQAIENLFKINDLFYKHWGLHDPLSTKAQFTSPWVVAVAGLGLILLPFAALESHSLKDQLQAQQQIQTLVQTRTSLNEALDETKGYLQKSTSDLMALNRKLDTTTRKLHATERKRHQLEADLTATTQALDTTRSTLHAREQALQGARTKLSHTEQTLSRTKAELEKTATALATTQSSLKSTQKNLETVQGYLNTRQKELDATTAALTEAKATNTTLQQKLLGTIKAPALQMQGLPHGTTAKGSHLIVPTDLVFDGKTNNLNPGALETLQQLATWLKPQLGSKTLLAIEAHTTPAAPQAPFADNNSLTATQAHDLGTMLADRGITSAIRPIGMGSAPGNQGQTADYFDIYVLPRL